MPTRLNNVNSNICKHMSVFFEKQPSEKKKKNSKKKTVNEL